MKGLVPQPKYYLHPYRQSGIIPHMPSPAPTYTPDDIAHLEWVRTQYRDICERLQAAVQKHNLAPPGEPQFLDKLVVAALDRLAAENAQLREDKARRAK